MTARRLARRHASTLGAFALCIVLFVVATAYSSGFAAPSHLRQLLVFASFIGIAALGETIVILGGGLDLSVPWLMAFGGIQLSHWTGATGLPDALNVVLVVLVGAGVGLVNGIGVTRLAVSPIVMTLGVGGLVQAYLLSIGLLQSQGNQVPHVVSSVAFDDVAGIPIIAIGWLVLAAIAGVLLARSAAGRRLYAAGTNEVVARLSGVNVERVRLVTYVVAGAASTFAGIVLAGYIGEAYLDIGAPYLFGSIAAVVVGGASILGGRGTYWGTVAGALTLTVLSAMLPLFNLNDAALKIVYGVVILVGVYISRLGGRVQESGG